MYNAQEFRIYNFLDTLTFGKVTKQLLSSRLKTIEFYTGKIRAFDCNVDFYQQFILTNLVESFI